MDEQECGSASLYPNILESELSPSLPLIAYGALDTQNEIDLKAELPSSVTDCPTSAAAAPSMVGQPVLGNYPVIVHNSKWIGNNSVVDLAVAGTSSSSTSNMAPSVPVFTCAQCRKEYKNIQELRFHVRTHKFILCVKCGKYFDSLAELVAHSSAFPGTHGSNHACLDCGLGFEGREDLEKHSYLHRTSYSITCQGLDGKIYDFFDFIKIVMKMPYKDLNLLNDGEESVEQTSSVEQTLSRKVIKACLLCRDVCIGNDAYTKHINNKHSCNDYVEPITCKVCGSTFITLTARKAHLNLFHKLDEDYEPLPYHQYKCTQCERAFSNLYALRGHVKKTHAEGCAPCQLCPEKFNSSEERDAHLVDKHGVQGSKKKKKHVAVKPKVLACDICEFRAESAALLSQHKMSHSDEHAFACGVCQQRFQTMLRCQEHIRKSHAVDNSYQCDLCPKSFKSLSGLNTHLRFHNNLRPYDCPGCGKGFHTKQNMLVHRDKHCKAKLEGATSATQTGPAH